MRSFDYMNLKENILKSKQSKIMNSATLLKANELEKQINELKQHYSHIKAERSEEEAEPEDFSSPYEGPKAVLSVETNTSATPKSLKLHFLPISIPELVEMYLARVEKEIKRLEKEFAKL